MSNNELLLAISGMLEPIREDIRVLKSEVAELKRDVAELKADVAELKADVAELKADVAELKADVAELKKDVNILKKDMIHVKNEIREIRTDLSQLTDRVTCLENYTKTIGYKQEVDVIPRLQNIEQCYLSTYERYKLSVDDHEVMKQDISVLKLVVTEHSDKLQRIS